MGIGRRTEGFSAKKPKEAGLTSGFTRRHKTDSEGFPPLAHFFTMQRQSTKQPGRLNLQI